MPDDVLTFEQLREIQSNEKNEDTLQDLGEDFFKRVKEYLERKKRIDTFESDKEYRNARHIIEDIIDRRQKKILRLSFLSTKSNLSVDNLHPEEQSFFDKIKDHIQRYQEKLKVKIGDGEEDEGESEVAQEEEVDSSAETEEKVQEKEVETESDDRTSEDEKEGSDTGEVKDGYTKVQVLEEVAEFMGTDLESYGPFEKGSEVVIPEESASALAEQGKVEK